MLAAGDGEQTTAVVLVDAALATGVRNEFGDSAVIRDRTDGSVEFSIPCANMSAFRLWLFAMVESAEVLAPESVREQVVQWLEELVAGK
jgi:predicted DNA-binding transcriptional regulator YafY